jgi:hypothetical protein
MQGPKEMTKMIVDMGNKEKMEIHKEIKTMKMETAVI